jgi:hypothetical protein
MSHRSRWLAALILLTVARAAPAEPLFTFSDDGRTVLYRARPGDHPSAVASMFGIPQEKLPAFLAANGIHDATRIGEGFVYRVPNTAAVALAERVATLDTENVRLKRELSEARDRVEQLTRETADVRSAATQAEERATRLARLGRLWPFLQVTLVLLALGAAAAAAMARAAMQRKAGAERYARGLAQELEEKRRAALTERQENARRTL